MVSKKERMELQTGSAAGRIGNNVEPVNDPVLPGQGGRMMRSDPVHPITESDVVSPEIVQARAYELYERNGRRDGGALDDWLQAESQLRVAQTDKSKSQAVISGPTAAAAPELSSNI